MIFYYQNVNSDSTVNTGVLCWSNDFKNQYCDFSKTYHQIHTIGWEVYMSGAQTKSNVLKAPVSTLNIWKAYIVSAH